MCSAQRPSREGFFTLLVSSLWIAGAHSLGDLFLLQYRLRIIPSVDIFIYWSQPGLNAVKMSVLDGEQTLCFVPY